MLLTKRWGTELCCLVVNVHVEDVKTKDAEGW